MGFAGYSVGGSKRGSYVGRPEEELSITESDPEKEARREGAITGEGSGRGFPNKEKWRSIEDGRKRSRRRLEGIGKG